jgi:hypothetical protein
MQNLSPTALTLEQRLHLTPLPGDVGALMMAAHSALGHDVLPPQCAP